MTGQGHKLLSKNQRIMAGINYLSQEGYDKLKAELEELKAYIHSLENKKNPTK